MGYKINKIRVGTQQVRPASRLPSAYQEVEYIGRNGNNYIDTGWIPKQTTPFEVQIGLKIETSGVRYAIGGNYNGSNGSISFEINAGWVSSNKARFYSHAASGTLDVFSSNSLNTSSFNDITFINNTNGNYSIVLNGTTTTGTVSSASTSVNYTAYLFIDRPLRWSTFSHNSFISYCKIYESGTLVRDFVPCYRISDSVIGLYDLVNNTFYTNSGSGTFTKGADVN